MKKIITAALFALSSSAFAATLNPIQLLNPAGSTAGQAIVSSGPSSAPAWSSTVNSVIAGSGVTVSGPTGNVTVSVASNAIGLGQLAQQPANTVLANATGSTANVTAFAMPSCSTSNSALQWSNGNGFNCLTGVGRTGNPLSQFAATTSAQLASVMSDETGSGNLVFGTSPTIVTATISGGTINNASVGTTTPSTGSFTTLAASSTITPSQTAGIVGTTTSNNANAGSIGEYVSASALSVSITSGTQTNMTSISLTAGDWDVDGVVQFNPAATTILSNQLGAISTTSGVVGAFPAYVNLTFNPAAGQGSAISVPRQRLSLSATTTVYVIAEAGFSVSTCTANGFIRARRVR